MRSGARAAQSPRRIPARARWSRRSSGTATRSRPRTRRRASPTRSSFPSRPDSLPAMSLEEHRREGEGGHGFAVVTVSDTRDASSDRGGAYLVEALEAAGHRVARRELVRDEVDAIRGAVRAACGDAAVELVLADRRHGPRAARRDARGAGRALRARDPGLRRALPAALLPGDRQRRDPLAGGGGVVGRKVVLALPGSPKALRLALEAIVLPEAGHLITQARGPA